MALLVQNLLGHGQLVTFSPLAHLHLLFQPVCNQLTLPWAICLLRKDQ